MTFGESDLAALAAAKEIKIETHSAAGTEHRTIIWVAEHDGAIYIRSVDGPARAGTARRRRRMPGRSRSHVDGRRLAGPRRARHGPGVVEACSEGLRAKYRRSYSLQSMLVDDLLDTTLRVEPA